MWKKIDFGTSAWTIFVICDLCPLWPKFKTKIELKDWHYF